MAFLHRRLLPAVFMLAVALPAYAHSGAQSGAARQGQPGRSSQPGAAQWNGPRGPELWWREKSPISKELGLSKEQTDRIEKLFQDSRPELNKLDDSLQIRENMLSQMIKDDYGEAMVAKQIDKVEESRSALNKARQLMLLRMRQVLTPPQRAKFEVLHAQFQRELQEADLARQKRQKDQNQNPKPDQRSAPDRQGRPGV